MSFFKLFFKNFDELWKTILKPPRQLYNPESLGPILRSVDGKDVIRKDFNIVNERKQTICCSLFEPRAESDSFPCVVFLHGINGSRLEALPLVDYLLSRNIGLLCFDFCGCGYSEGDLVTMGLNESDDVKAVVEHLRKERRISSLILWGRSMGSVTALIYASKDPGISCLVLDSPYYSLEKVFEDIAKSRLYMPGFIVNGGVASVKNQIVENLGVDIFSIDLKRIAERMKRTPALFLSAEKDKVVQPYQVETLYKHYGGEKKIITVDGDHNSMRPISFFKSAIEFCLSKCRVIRNNPSQLVFQYDTAGHYSFDKSKRTSFLGREPKQVTGPMSTYRDNSMPNHINRFESMKKETSRENSPGSMPKGFSLKTHDGENRFKLQLSPEKPMTIGGRHVNLHNSHSSLRKLNSPHEQRDMQLRENNIYQNSRDRILKHQEIGSRFADREVDDFRVVRPYSSNMVNSSNMRAGLNSEYSSPTRNSPFLGNEPNYNSPYKHHMVSPQMRRAFNNIPDPKGLSRATSFAVVEPVQQQNNYQQLYFY